MAFAKVVVSVKAHIIKNYHVRRDPNRNICQVLNLYKIKKGAKINYFYGLKGGK